MGKTSSREDTKRGLQDTAGDSVNWFNYSGKYFESI